MGKPTSTPAAPDYKGAAEATAAGNLANTQATTAANRVNSFTPYGNLTYTKVPGASTDDTAGYQAALEKYNAAAGTHQTRQNSNGEYEDVLTGPTGPAPTQDQFKTTAPDTWNSTITLSPDQQRLLDQQNKTSLGLGALQDQATGRVAGMMGQAFDTSKLPAIAQMGTTFQPGAGPGPAYDPTKGPQLGTAYSAGQSPSLSSYYDPTKSTNTATEAILSRVAPQLARNKEAMDSQLANQGITNGSEAWKNSQDQFGRDANDAYTQASLQGINLGLAQQGQTFNQSVTGQNQSMGQQAQQFGQNNANVTTNAAQQAQMFGQGLSAAQLAQSQQAQQYGQQNQNFQNSEQARQQALQEQAYIRGIPLNELNALRSGAQVTNPTFSNVPQQQYVGGPDLLGAATGQYNAAMQAANAQNAGNAGMTNGIVGLAAAAATAY